MDQAHVVWTTDREGFNNGELDLIRLTNLSTHKGDGSSIDSCLSGTFYNSDQSGHGVMLQVLGEASESMVVTWFVHHQGQQFWLIGNGLNKGESSQMSAFYTMGSDFPPNFDPNQNAAIEWGHLTVEKQDNNTIELNWAPNDDHSDFGSGSIQMQRLTQIKGLECD